MSATKPFIYEGDEVVELEKEPGQTPEDAYAAYVQRRREQAEEDEVVEGTLVLPRDELNAIAVLIEDLTKLNMKPEDKRFWLRIRGKILSVLRDLADPRPAT